MEARGTGLRCLSTAQDTHLVTQLHAQYVRVRLTSHSLGEEDFSTVTVELHRGALQNDCKGLLYVGFFWVFH